MSCIVGKVLGLLHLSDFINAIILICMTIFLHEFSVEFKETNMDSRLAIINALFKVVLLNI